MLQRPVEDRTSTEGRFDILLKWQPDDSTASASSSQELSTSSIFAAVDDELGLKLLPQKVDVSVLVIDHAERSPAAN